MLRAEMNAPKINLYGADWPANADPLSIERECIRRNGKWQRKNGEQAGNGLAFHYRKFQELLWPEKIWEKGPYKNFWAEQCLAAYLSHTYIGVMGSAASGKSDSFGSNVLTDWYCWPECTTVLVSSTELKSLELRIWGMIKRYHRSAKERYPWLPGHLIEGRQMIVEHSREESQAGREFKNGIMAVACKRGDRYVGLGCFPAGTLIDTEKGPRAIETINPGDLVWSAIGLRRVRACSTRNAAKLVRIHLSNGTTIDCTPNHPFLTYKGFIPAIDIPSQTVIVSRHETMRAVYGDIERRPSGLLQPEMQRQVLDSHMSSMSKRIRSKRPQSKSLLEILLDEIEDVGQGLCAENLQQARQRSYGAQGQCYNHGKSKREASSSEAGKINGREEAIREREKELDFETCERRQGFWKSWEWLSAIKRGMRSVGIIPGSTVQLLNSEQSISKRKRWLALLQAGFGLARNQVVRGTGRRDTLKDNSKAAGQEEGFSPAIVRVESVEILEPSGDKRYIESERMYRVYNLEVEGHPSYCVADLVSHNSYIGIHNKRLRLLADECFPTGTMVDTPCGPIPIQEIKVGDMVVSADGNRSVLRTSTRIAETLVRIHMRDGLFVDCTPEHPFLTLSGWVEAFKLQPHQYIMSPHERLGVMGWSTPDRQLVRNVEILKRAGDKRYIESEGGYRVHNLEVDGDPSYSVQGLVVHNCNLMPRAFLDSAANLSKCDDFKMVGLGNPNETTNAHGLLCEPHPDDGGWEAGIDQAPGTKTWRTKFPNGICVQLPGSDSPNLKAPAGERVPFPFLITRKQMEEDAQIWGVDDWHYTMMNESRMPRGQGSRRVLTRQTCEKFGAFRKPEWRDNVRTSVTFLDAAFRGVGGDRCVFGELQFGSEATPIGGAEIASSIISQGAVETKYPQIVALVDLMVVPIKSGRIHESPEDQIVWFVKNEHQRRNIPPDNFYYDAGMRTSLVQAFSRGWSTMVNSIDSMGKPSEEKVSAEIDKPCCEYYSKFVTELWFSVRLVVESGQFRGMTDELCNEFSAREWKMASGNRIEVESKDEMKAKIGRSPDLADAVAYGIYGCRRRGFVISRQFNEGRNRVRRGRDWRDEIRDRARAAWQSGGLVYSA